MNAASAQFPLVLDPILPVPVIGLLAVVWVGLTWRWYWRMGRMLRGWQTVVLSFFRGLGLVAVVALLLQPSRRVPRPPLTPDHVVFLAIDTSLSMKQPDFKGMTRLEAAQQCLLEAGVGARQVQPSRQRIRLFQFDADARALSGSVLELAPGGTTTRFHKSIGTVLNSLGPGKAADALVLLTDGHDFELANPAATAAEARRRRVPLYAVPLGQQGKVRDVSARITSYQPYCYVQQTARITGVLRAIGCEFEDLTVELLRQGTVVQTQRLNAGELPEVPVVFEVTESEVGQYEYEIRAAPVENEVDPANNVAMTYLNVIDQQIRVLVLEGEPYWDSTFLIRSLMRNDKFDVDSLVAYGVNRLRGVRKSSELGELRTPARAEDMAAYDLIVLGRAVERLLNPEQVAQLEAYVRDLGGALIFSRGQAFGPGTGADTLQPVTWGDRAQEHVQLLATPQGRSVSAFRALNGPGGGGSLPDLLRAREALESKPLAATLALAQGAGEAATVPGVVHWRYGRGQVLSVGVDGLWRWALNAQSEGPTTAFDRFWDELMLWLLAGRDLMPARAYSLRTSSANVQLGEKIFFRLSLRQPDPTIQSVPIRLFYGERELARTSLTTSRDSPGRLTAEFLPDRPGRYRAVVSLPDGTEQESRFIVFVENLEETEVATDAGFLRRLCEGSGGRILAPGELSSFLDELRGVDEAVEVRTELEAVWNESWVLYLIGLCYGIDWYLRRRWGLC